MRGAETAAYFVYDEGGSTCFKLREGKDVAWFLSNDHLLRFATCSCDCARLRAKQLNEDNSPQASPSVYFIGEDDGDVPGIGNADPALEVWRCRSCGGPYLDRVSAQTCCGEAQTDGGESGLTVSPHAGGRAA